MKQLCTNEATLHALKFSALLFEISLWAASLLLLNSKTRSSCRNEMAMYTQEFTALLSEKNQTRFEGLGLLSPKNLQVPIKEIIIAKLSYFF